MGVLKQRAIHIWIQISKYVENDRGMGVPPCLSVRLSTGENVRVDVEVHIM